MRKKSGQAVTEMIFLLPLFVVLAAGCAYVSYMCWQGIKVQQAANIAGRIAGQETVGGAKDFSTMMADNGLVTSLGADAAGDPDPSAQCSQTDPTQRQQCLQALVQTNGGGTSSALGTKLDANGLGAKGVYWDFRKLVYKYFSGGEQKRLFVPAPQTRDGVSQVKVSRIMVPPSIFGWKPPVVQMEAHGYGSEDTFIGGLPRWGRTDNSNTPYWQQQMNTIATTNSAIRTDTTGE